MVQINALSVQKSFSDSDRVIDALGPLDIDISQGEFICILGQSGCGKSSLLRLFAGLE